MLPDRAAEPPSPTLREPWLAEGLVRHTLRYFAAPYEEMRLKNPDERSRPRCAMSKRKDLLAGLEVVSYGSAAEDRALPSNSRWALRRPSPSTNRVETWRLQWLYFRPE